MKKRIVSILLAVCLLCSISSVTVLAAGFSDTKGHWAESAIDRWASLGLAGGYEDGTFRPDDVLIRGELAALISTMLGLSEQAENRFGDLPADAWYTPYVLKCVQAGIIGGTEVGAEPEATVTREQASVMFARAFCISGKEGRTSFADDQDISWWAVHDVKAMADRTIVVGMGDNMFCPQEPLTRAQAVTILSAAVSAYTKQADSSLTADNSGITLVAAPGVTVTGKAQDVLVAPGASNSEVRLENCDVNGNLTVNAPGCTVILANGTSAPNRSITDYAVGAKIIEESEQKDTIYSLHDNYYAVRSAATDKYVKGGNGVYTVDGETKSQGEKFYFKAAGLGEYILYDSASCFVYVSGSGNVVRNQNLEDNIIWKVEEQKDNTFSLYSEVVNKYLAVSGDSLVTVDSVTDEARFYFDKATGNNPYPEADTNVTITDANGNEVDWSEALARPTSGQNVVGYMDTHLHSNHNLGSGEVVFAGSTFSKLGILDALSDCSDVHGVGSAYDVWGKVVDGAVTHDTSGYPDFNYWPTAFSTNHQQCYYKWLERSFLAGQRIFVHQCVNNETLGQVTNLLPPYKNGRTDDMEIVKVQIQNLYDEQDYIDAQCGGPGEGWFRICTSASQARDVISQGKMAVFIGIEVDTIFGCEEDYVGEYNNGQISKETCDAALANIESQMDELYGMGVRSFFPIHAMDNGFGGTQVYQGPIFEVMEYMQRQEVFSEESADNPRVYYKEYPAALNLEEGSNGVQNTKGLSETGEWLIHKMIEKKFLIEVDHLSDKSFNKILDICWEEKYPGIIASHTRILDMFDPEDEAWEQMDIPRMIKILQLGGIVSCMAIETVNGHQICVSDYLEFMINLSNQNKGKAGTSATMYNSNYENYGGPYEVPTSWYSTNSESWDDLILGVPYGTDVNGACMLPTLEESGDEYTPVNYDDGSFGALHDGVYSSKVANVRFDRQTTGNRSFDINGDRAVAHYGLIPDLLQLLSSRPDRVNLDATFNSAEAYLRMLERVDKYSDTYPSRDPSDWVTTSTEYWHGNY